MTTDQQMILFGAAIGFISSILTVVATGLLNHYLENKRRLEEKEGTLFKLLGEGFAIGNMSNTNDSELGLEATLEIAKQSVKEAKSISELDFVLGITETMTGELRDKYKTNKELKQQLHENERKIAWLEAQLEEE